MLECAAAGAIRYGSQAQGHDYEEVVRHLLASCSEPWIAEDAASALQLLAGCCAGGGKGSGGSVVGVSKLLVDRLLHQAQDLDQLIGSLSCCTAAMCHLRTPSRAAADACADPWEKGQEFRRAAEEIFMQCDAEGSGRIPQARAVKLLTQALSSSIPPAQLEEDILRRFQDGDVFRYRDFLYWLYPPPLLSP